MGDRATNNRMVAGRGVTPKPKPKPNILVQWVPPKKWLLVFDDWTFEHEVARYLFKSGKLPNGFSLEPTRKYEGNPSLYWTLNWPGLPKDYLNLLTPLGSELFDRTGVLTGRGSNFGDEFPEDRYKRENDEAIQRDINRQHNQLFLPALNMTADAAMRTLKPGAYVAAPNQKIVKLPSVGPGEGWPPNVE